MNGGEIAKICDRPYRETHRPTPGDRATAGPGHEAGRGRASAAGRPEADVVARDQGQERIAGHRLAVERDGERAIRGQAR